MILYFVVACGSILMERLISGRAWHLPLIVDLLALGYLIVVSPSMVPAWFPYLFVCYVAGNRWGLNSAFPLAGVLSLEIVLLTAVRGEMHWLRIVYWVGFVAATFAAGAGIAFLGDRNRLFAVQNEFFARITATMLHEPSNSATECPRAIGPPLPTSGSNPLSDKRPTRRAVPRPFGPAPPADGVLWHARHDVLL